MEFLMIKYMITSRDVVKNSDGTLNFLNVFEDLQVSEFPAKIDFHLILNIEYSLPKNKSNQLKIRFFKPGEERILDLSEDDKVDVKLRLSESDPNSFVSMTHVLHMKKIKVDSSGVFSMIVFHENEFIYGSDFLVVEGGI